MFPVRIFPARVFPARLFHHVATGGTPTPTPTETTTYGIFPHRVFAATIFPNRIYPGAGFGTVVPTPTPTPTPSPTPEPETGGGGGHGGHHHHGGNKGSGRRSGRRRAISLESLAHEKQTISKDIENAQRKISTLLFGATPAAEQAVAISPVIEGINPTSALSDIHATNEKVQQLQAFVNNSRAELNRIEEDEIALILIMTIH